MRRELPENKENNEVSEKENNSQDNYSEKDIITLEWNEHIRRRPGMYIGRFGDGSQADDGQYVLIKEVMDNAMDEYMMGFGKTIELRIDLHRVTVRDYGRGIPLEMLIDAVAKMNTGGKFDTKSFKMSVGLNGVGVKAVNALSSEFRVRSVREGRERCVNFSRGVLIDDNYSQTTERNGTEVSFIPDPSEEIFGSYNYDFQLIESMIQRYTYLNPGLVIKLNDKSYVSKNGLLDLLNDNMQEPPLYPPIHLKGDNIEVAITHGQAYSETYYSFVNGQYTSLGGTHQAAFREAVAKTVKEFFRKDYDPSDVRTSIIAAISIKVQDPKFENQPKTKFGSKDMAEGGPSVRSYISDFLKNELDNYLHMYPETASAMGRKIQANEKERKQISGLQKRSREMAKKVSLNNSKLRDCKIHFTDQRNPRNEESMIFITEGLSASGSITASRDVQTQAVFSLRGKPKNCFGLSKTIVYKNEEFNLLQAALNIEEDIDNLRYNKIVIATDADVDGMHIRLLMMTFFLQFFPDVIRRGHLYVLQTPLFRVRNKRQTFYCYSEEERQRAIAKLGANPEITRFKGLGEISVDEFKDFIGKSMRIERVKLSKDDPIHDMLEFYMGKNSPERQVFMQNNLRIEADYAKDLI